MAPFRPKREHELSRLDDEALVDYAQEARAAGDTDAATLALQILMFGMEGDLIRFARGRIGDFGGAAIEDVVAQTIADACAALARAEAEAAGQVRAFVFRIARRRIADALRGRREEDPLPDEEPQGGRDDPPGAIVDRLHERGLVGRALEEIDNDVHRDVVVRFHFDELSARETAAAVNRHFEGRLNDPMTEQNVNQICSRFRRRLKELCAEEGE